MLVPRNDGNEYLCRTVVTTCFPAFLYLLGEHFTAREVEDAWVKLPIVKAGKRNRGTSAGEWRWSGHAQHDERDWQHW